MENKQTAVEFLKEKLTYVFVNDKSFNELFEQAKQMEKEQIIQAAKWMPKPFESMEFLPELAQQYYNETYETT